MKKLPAVFTAFLALSLPLSAQSVVDARELYRRGQEAQLSYLFFEALEYYAQALAVNPFYLDALIASAECYFALGEYEQAMDLCERALRLSRANTRVLSLQGRINIGLGRLDAAARIFETILRSEPNNLSAKLGLAELDVAAGKHRAAGIRYENVLRLMPENKRALLSLALLYQETGEPAASARYIELARRFHGGDAQVRFLSADLYLRRGRLEDAEQEVLTALSIRPDHQEASMLLARLRYMRGDYEGSIDIVDRLIAADRRNSAAIFLRAQAARRMDDTDAAFDTLEALLSFRPDDELARVAIEDLLITSFRIEDGRRARYAAHHLNLGRAFEGEYLNHKALAHYRRALQIDPYFADAKRAYAEMLHRSGFPARALEEYRFLSERRRDTQRDRDLIEIIEGELGFGVAASWGFKQFHHDRQRTRVPIALYFSPHGEMSHPDTEMYLMRFFRSSLQFGQRLEPIESISRVSGFNEAFQDARQRGSDFFAILTFSATDKEFHVDAALHLGRTGTLVRRLQVYRTGSGRFHDGLLHLAEQIENVIPLRGNILQRRFDRALISLGRVDGVDVGTELLIVSGRTLRLRHDGPEFSYREEDVLGTVTITGLDDMVAEGTISKRGFFDRINAGDFVIGNPTTPRPADAAVSPPRRPLYQRIRSIH